MPQGCILKVSLRSYMRTIVPVLTLVVVALSSCTSNTAVPYFRDGSGNNSHTQPILTNEKQAFCMDRIPDSDSQYVRTRSYNWCMRNVDDLMRKQREAREAWERDAPIREQQAQQERIRSEQEYAAKEQNRRMEEQENERKNQQQINEYNRMFNF